jgi:hypothetical protein
MKMRFKASIQLRKLVGVILLVCGLLLYGERRVSGAETEGKATIIVFDAPGASTGQFQGTFPTAINPAGAIVGYYYSTVLDQFGNNIPQAFLRASNGTFRSFDPKRSLAALGAPGGSKAFGINPAGAITGYYYGTDAYGNSVTHCFLRDPDGNFTNVDPPGSLGSNDQNPIVINPTRDIAGNYSDPSTGLYRGFLRYYSNRKFVNIDPPNSNSSNGIAPQAINPTDAVTGYFQDTNAYYPGFRAFLRYPSGTITVFDPPEDVATPGSEYIVPSGINPAGVIAGSYQAQYQQPFYHGFLRDFNGTFTVIDVPNSASNQGTYASAINPAGTITGY